MIALVLDGVPRVVHDYPSPRPTSGEALLKVRLAGLCDTDVQLARGYMTYKGVLGHEFVGEVLESQPSWQGKRAVADINLGCGNCPACQSGEEHHCPSRAVLGILRKDGCLAELVTVPERCLREVPEGLEDDKAVFAEPLAAALHVLDDIPKSAQEVLVLGDGKLGLLTALALRSAGLSVLVVGHHTEKLALAKRVGAEVSLSATGLERWPVVVEATGSSQGLTDALRLVHAKGVLILKTTVADRLTVDLAPVVVQEIRIVGSRCGDLSRALRALNTGAIDPRPLIAARFTLHQADRALERAAQRGVLKVLVDPNAPKG